MRVHRAGVHHNWQYTGTQVCNTRVHRLVCITTGNTQVHRCVIHMYTGLVCITTGNTQVHRCVIHVYTGLVCITAIHRYTNV